MVTSDNGKVPITTTVVDGMVSVHLNPTDTYMLQVATATDSTNESDWSEWDTELPEGVSLNSNVVQVDIMYRTRQKEFKTYNRETLDGWNLYETFENEQPYGVWSDWTETMLTGDENLEVAEQKQYRYRIKEFTSSQYSTMAGWTQNGVENKYEYGEWSAWRDAQIVASATTEVETKKTYNYVVNCYEDGQFLGQEYLPYQFDPGVPVGGVLDEGDGGDGHYYTFIVDSITITEQYRSRTKTVVSTTYNYYRWTDWSEWNEEEVVASDTCEVEDRVLFCSREIYGDTAYRFWKWSDWSDWTLEKPSEGEDAEVESCVVYRYIP